MTPKPLFIVYGRSTPSRSNYEGITIRKRACTISEIALDLQHSGLTSFDWRQLDLVFEAYPERLEREDNEG